MKASFQILTQPWIPVKELDGSMKELSLLETLERAHLLSEIQDPSPMVSDSFRAMNILQKKLRATLFSKP